MWKKDLIYIAKYEVNEYVFNMFGFILDFIILAIVYSPIVYFRIFRFLLKRLSGVTHAHSNVQMWNERFQEFRDFFPSKVSGNWWSVFIHFRRAGVHDDTQVQKKYSQTIRKPEK